MIASPIIDWQASSLYIYCVNYVVVLIACVHMLRVSN